MPNITVLPHPDFAPEGATFYAEPGGTLCDAMLAHRVEIEHACGKVGACTTCHVIIREGYGALEDPSDGEEDMLDRAWGLAPTSRLSCQVVLGEADLVVEIPRYSINLEKEKG
ncbi:ISC system 2Fe-2S type ferredoxin [Massilia solisilvae]|uniref:2Fe-2S ferredoxin n=1 Tax=Massilia solisilvae TaxID=1811225 RepID=A0ABT2BIS5_9BURK|nr:ISC system 2Fe-2S type ferredoxin [Massilia solisilvae]MCS0608360.1 ISC system 2Fe-2S type ferredoxin [Massilia solisilvae]